MFILELYDRKGEKLNLGDIVKISDGRRIQFYARVTYIEAEQLIAPFHTFSFMSMEKVESLPEGVQKSSEERYDVWFHPGIDGEPDVSGEEFNRFLIQWREVEHHVEKRMWRIKKQSDEQARTRGIF